MALPTLVVAALLPILALADQTYIVVLKEEGWASAALKDPTLKSADKAAAYKNSLVKQHDSIISSMSHGKSEGPNKIYSYVNALSGFAAQLSAPQVESLQGNSAVEYVVPEFVYKTSTISTPRMLGLQGGSAPVWNNVTGKEVVIGVVDTGIYPTNPSFNDAGLAPPKLVSNRICQTPLSGPAFKCNNKLIGARYFYAGYVSATRKSVAQVGDYASAMDVVGHGTHTASTAAGAQVLTGVGRLSGMAYDARIIAYKVCWGAGSLNNCYGSDMTAAFDAGVGDRVSLFTASLGPSRAAAYSSDGGAMLILSKVIQAGIPFVYSAGNSGGVGTVVNTAPWVLTVAASTHDRLPPSSTYRYLRLGNRVDVRGLSSSTWNSLSDKYYPLIIGAMAGPASATAELCLQGSLSPSLVQGKIVICKNGVNARSEKSLAVARAGGVGMVLYNPTADYLYSEEHAVPTLHSPASAIASAFTYLRTTSTPTGSAVYVPVTYPTMASFSSTGPNAASKFVIKPDITAPGVDVMAAYSGGYTTMSGTSMAAPHAAGIVGLIRAAYPNWAPGRIYSAIITTGTTLDSTRACIKDPNYRYCASPLNMGGGHLNPRGALNPGLVYDMPWSAYDSYSKCTTAGGWTRATAACPTRIPETDFNFPYLSIPSLPVGLSLTTTRYLTNVGVPGRYTVTVLHPAGATIVVTPSVLTFTRAEQTLSYTIRVTAQRSFSRVIGGTSYDPRFQFTYGSITWNSGAYSVKANVIVFVP